MACRLLAALLALACLAGADAAGAAGNRGIDGAIEANSLNGTAADNDRYYEYDCNSGPMPTPSAADRLRFYCKTGSPDRPYWKDDQGNEHTPAKNACSPLTQNAAEAGCLDGKGELPVGTGSGGAATTMSPGANGTVKEADSSQATGWVDRKPLVLEQVLVKTSATDRGGSSSPSDDPDLTFSAAASTTYVLMLTAGWRSAGTATDLKFGWNVPASATVDGYVTSTLGANVMTARVNADVTASVLDLINNTLGFTATAKVVTSGAGTVALWWSGNSGSGTAELAAGSVLLVLRQQS